MTLQQEIHHTEQIADAIQRHEDEYASWELQYAIPLPKPQTAGTMMQQRSYATDKAKELINQYDRRERQ